MFYGNGVRDVKREGCSSSKVVTKRLTSEQLEEINKKYPSSNKKIPLILSETWKRGKWVRRNSI
ncbi:hypothetical protein [Crassaminicella profunda]|uniref:hypothetical protein n=1 Tax=Crassaminicella profunda TaxID=1286698 RepID=UPI001CA65A15|nr:hypothetical protein [Crassaminicella profunda]QZY56690.1 hypothetical protein K7H06_07155 [Crassaminicella profunda]